MKKRLIAVLTMSMMLLAMLAMQSFADDTKYKVTIYSGNQGHFATGKSWTQIFDYNEMTGTIDLASLGFEYDNDKYYVRGFRLTGHDNDETTGSISMNFAVDKDYDYEIAYGIKGNMTEYTVRYVDQGGNDIHDPDTFYGKIGDKPMVAFRYVEGYLPTAYNITGTLTGEDDEFVFRYEPAEENVTVTTTTVLVPGAPGAGAGAGAAAGAGAGAGADGADGQNIADAQTPTADNPAQVVDMDDNEVPTEDPDNVEDAKTPLSEISTPVKIAGVAALIIAIAAIVAAIARSRRKNEE